MGLKQTTSESFEETRRAELRGCPQCAFRVTNPFVQRCPRCNALLPMREVYCNGCLHSATCPVTQDQQHNQLSP
ncbi:MAG TPA: hypothetical protein DCP63_13645 [Bacteroidetes bacterium]|nr:hypothetical protein [Bacteroidota bacterium]